MSTWRVHPRTAGLAELDPVDWRLINLIPRFNEVGAWKVTVPMDAKAGRWASDGGVIVYKDNRRFFTGRVSGFVEDGAEDGTDLLTIHGDDDLGYIADKLAWPVPGSPVTSQTDAHYVFPATGTAAAETVMRAYVDVNCGPSQLVARRRVAALTLAPDQGRGTLIKGSARFDPETDLLRQLAIAGGGLGFRVVQDGASLVFEVYVPADRQVTFSRALGNLRAYHYSEDAPTATFPVVAGQGQAEQRIFRTLSDARTTAAEATWGRSVETFIDRRDTSDDAELDQALEEAVTGGAPQVALTATLIDTPRVAFGVDFGLGDRVPVVLPSGKTVVDVVREVRITVDNEANKEGNEDVQTIVGTVDAGLAVPAADADVRQILARLGVLERSQ